MRIVSGMAGGIRLEAPDGRGVRPTGDRVKESLFGSLGDICGWTVVDLFSGSGALGLEALSRGAKTVHFFERDRRTVRYIEKNLTRVRTAMNGQEGETEVHTLPAERAPRRLPSLCGSVDLVLADPPYHPRTGEYGSEKLLEDADFAAWANGALLVLEHETGTDLPWLPKSPWKVLKVKRFGTQCLSFARQRVQPEQTET
ncbi:MAG: 16S rRNA (guanine(966)-N(2))-methyltransferase RsmD [Lentisphaeria bacterium]|nr:16S rRNA (guanine(966)-N(2))-methyltransferase RsmD [Lentisphaeria bacterium]